MAVLPEDGDENCRHAFHITDVRRTASGVAVTTLVHRPGVVRAQVLDEERRVNLVQGMRRVGRGRVIVRLPVNADRSTRLRAALSLENEGSISLESRLIS